MGWVWGIGWRFHPRPYGRSADLAHFFGINVPADVRWQTLECRQTLACLLVLAVTLG
ncbi:hypothetical protein RSSM_01843 [Rhodopirellula sallentina SM41]|uniref:Uncharacterized protein n=1 Tax=Rhodopirellula sallentina SM41 TaxID=1263870 RepID=M5UL50_9BACT|nr:hypothetical protein RSSM_01843 [Rhodopirellula sallentina SM41]